MERMLSRKRRKRKMNINFGEEIKERQLPNLGWGKGKIFLKKVKYRKW